VDSEKAKGRGVDDVKEPCGPVGQEADRDRASGRFVAGNRAALVVGASSSAFWAAHAAARREIWRDVIADFGYTETDAPRALQLAADGLAQASLLRESAFAKLVESGGPMTSAGRTRRAFVVWQVAADRVEHYLRLVGLQRRARPTLNVAAQFAQLHREGQS
jgi:hypothetical protein